MRQKYVALDLGCSSLVLASGTISERGLLFSNISETESTGIKQGRVKDKEALIQAVSSFFKQKLDGHRLPPLFLCFPGQHVIWEKKEATIELSSKPVSWKEIEALQLSICEASQTEGQQLLHCVPLHYVLDDKTVVDDPLSMSGQKLTLKALVAKTFTDLLEEYLECIHQSGADIEAVIAQPLAEGECFNEEEKIDGTALLNLGCMSSTMSIFFHGHLMRTCSVSVGGNYIDRDLAYALKIPVSEAEKIKKQYVRLDDPYACKPHKTSGIKAGVSPDFIHHVVEARVEEIFHLLKQKMIEDGKMLEPLKKIVLTGGTANLKGIDRLAEKSFQCPVRIGKGGFPVRGAALVQSPAHIPAVGTLFYAYYNYEYSLPFWHKCARIGRMLLKRMTNFF